MFGRLGGCSRDLSPPPQSFFTLLAVQRSAQPAVTSMHTRTANGENNATTRLNRQTTQRNEQQWQMIQNKRDNKLWTLGNGEKVHSGEFLNRAKTIYAYQEIYVKYTTIGIHCSLIMGKLRQFNRISVLFSFPESYLTWIIKHKHIHNIFKIK